MGHWLQDWLGALNRSSDQCSFAGVVDDSGHCQIHHGLREKARIIYGALVARLAWSSEPILAH